MSKEQFEKLLKDNEKKIDNSLKIIEEADKRIKENITTILKRI